MDSTDYILTTLRKDITQTHLQLRAITQDVNACVGPMIELHNLNDAGRSKISAMRKFIDKLNDIARDNNDTELLREVNLQREQLLSAMESFKRANVKSLLTIEKGIKEELMTPANEETVMRQRQKHDKESLVKMSSNVTDQLLSISRQLAETTQRSADTLDALVVSSDNVTGTQEELILTSGVIGQSGKLLAKYGRREVTDKILMFFAFAFFVACVVYIVQKRVF